MKSKRLLKLIVPISLVAVVLIALPLASGCRPTAPPPAEEPIKIGCPSSRSGYFASAGEDMYRGNVLFFEQQNYEVAGRPVEVIYEDVASDATVGMDKVRKLIETDKVCAISGMTQTSVWDAIGPYLTRMKVPGLSSSGCPRRELLGGWPFWAHTGVMPQSSWHLGFYCYDVLGWRTVSALTYEAEFAKGYVDDGFCGGFESRGGKVVQIQHVPLDILDFTPYFTKVKDADGFALYLLGDSILPGIAQMREIGLWDRMPTVMPLAEQLFDPYFLEEAGELTVGLTGTVDWSQMWDTPGNQEFIEAYRERWDAEPGVYGAGAYVCQQILFNAIERTGGDVSFEALCKALDETDMDTIRGRMTFTDRMGCYDSWIMKRVSTTEPQVEVLAIYRTTARIVGDHIEISTERVE